MWWDGFDRYYYEMWYSGLLVTAIGVRWLTGGDKY